MADVSIKYKGSAIAEMNASGTKTLGTNGKYCEGDVVVTYDRPTASEVVSGSKSITSNGTHDVTAYKDAVVNVPIPDGYIVPSGTKSITTNGAHDIAQYASANVNVPVPSGYIKPSGTKEITENGTFDVTSFASALVNVPIPDVVVKSVTAIYNNTSADGNVPVTLISGNSFIKEHYADDNAFALVVKLTSLQVNGQIFFMNTNKDYGVTASGGSTHVYGIWGSNSATVVNVPSRTTKPLKETATAVGHMYATSDGDLVVRAGGGISAFQTGTYFVMFGVMEE